MGLLLSDDWLAHDALEVCLGIDADIVSTGALRYAENGDPIPHLRRALSPEQLAKRQTLEERASYLTHFFLFRKSKVIEAGGLDETS